MPKRGKKGQTKPKKGKSKGSDSGSGQSNVSSNQQENRMSAMSTSTNDVISNSLGQQDIAKMVQEKIRLMESSQNRSENSKLISNKDEILKTLNAIKEDFDNAVNKGNNDENDHGNDTMNETKNKNETETETATNETNETNEINETKTDESNSQATQPLVKHFNTLCSFVERINGVFYEITESETSLKNQSDRLIQQNKTFKDLCHRLNEENRNLKTRMQEIEKHEKAWREEMDLKFQNSFADIKTKIGKHEEQYGKVVKENESLKSTLTKILDDQTKRNEAFEQYRKHQGQLTEIQEKEKENLRQMLESENMQHKKCQKHLQEYMVINKVLNTKCDTYEKRMKEMSDTITQSSSVIDQFKEMNQSIMQQNKDLSKKLETVMSRYKQLNSINDLYSQKAAQSEAKVGTLSNLCRSLQAKNGALTNDFKAANAKLISCGQNPIAQTQITIASPEKESGTKKIKSNESDKNGKNSKCSPKSGKKKEKEKESGNAIENDDNDDNNEGTEANENNANENIENGNLDSNKENGIVDAMITEQDEQDGQAKEKSKDESDGTPNEQIVEKMVQDEASTEAQNDA